ncbi:MAG TPA: cation-translocating P-type ATPase, partial [Rhodanobacteraceae bacterium]|nr:cation-translocating P-type ATPase [Rhodanobacteraceae bacterium]
MSAPHAVWLRPELARQVLRPRRDGKADLALKAPDLQTPYQALRLEQWLQALRGVFRVNVDIRARRIRATLLPDLVDIPRLLDACAKAGCPAEPLPHNQLDDDVRHEADDALRRLVVAGLFGMQAMMFAFVLYIGVVDAVDATTIQLFRWLGLLSATPVVGYAAVPFFRHALTDLRRGRAGIDAPIALAVLLIYLASLWATFTGHGETWFDSACMLIFVLLLGRYLELRARHQQQAFAQAGNDAMPLIATRRQADGKLEAVAIAELVVGDTVHVTEGGVVPVDGMLTTATARIDTSMHTGESHPQVCRRGDPVAAGSLVLGGSLELRVTRKGADGSIARLHELIRHTRRQHARMDDAACASVSWFIGGVLLLAMGTLAFWMWRDPARAMDATVAVLVVACPCAFALAAPATLTRAVGLLSRCGVFVVRPRALLALARVDRAIFDKTGTLTRPEVDARCTRTDARVSAAQATAWAVALARESSHPLACAMVRAHADLETAPVADVEVVAGHGIRGTVHGHALFLGRPPADSDLPDDGCQLCLADADGLLASFGQHESLRPDTHETLLALRDHGIHSELCSGDAHERVEAMARSLELSTWHARQTPEDKYRLIRRRQADGDTVLAVGDGVNDAAALAAADVSASLMTATDLARHQADVILGDRLHGLLQARRMALQVRRTLRQNRRWGLAWNAMAVPFAAAGLISPWLA